MSDQVLVVAGQTSDVYHIPGDGEEPACADEHVVADRYRRVERALVEGQYRPCSYCYDSAAPVNPDHSIYRAAKDADPATLGGDGA